jgi:hypothetical protein
MIYPGQRLILPCVVKTGVAGHEFAGQIHLWLDDYGLRELVVHVKGQVVANRSN